jgi:hypothetical protein
VRWLHIFYGSLFGECEMSLSARNLYEIIVDLCRWVEVYSKEKNLATSYRTKGVSYPVRYTKHIERGSGKFSLFLHDI